MTDEFTKDTIKKFGPRGSPVFEREQKKTDLDELSSRTETTAIPFCTCGAQITAAPTVYRCCSCELICCERCQIRHSKHSYCPTCARRQYDLDKRTFLALVFLQHGHLVPDDLVAVTTVADEPVEITIDTAVDALLRNNYLADDEARTLSSAGQEALHVGHQLYGDDEDVQAIMNQIKINEVSSR